MTRVTSDVDVLNELFSAGVVAVFGDVFTLLGIMVVVLVAMDWRLALHDLLGAAADRGMVTQWFRRHVRESYRQVRLWIAKHQRVPAGEHHRHGHRAAVPARARATSALFDEVNRGHRDANIEGIFYYAVFYPAIEVDRGAGQRRSSSGGAAGGRCRTR